LPVGSGPAALVHTARRIQGDQRLAVLNLETGERHELAPGMDAVYSPEGYLIHGASGAADPGLWALPFSLANLQPTGESFPVSTDGVFPSVSQDGTLVYRDPLGTTGRMKTLVWRNRAGLELEKVGQPQLELREFTLSPDGRRVVTTVGIGSDNDIWVQDLIRSIATRLTFDPASEYQPAWSASGRDVSYVIEGRGLWRKAGDGTGEPAVLVEAGGGSPGYSSDDR
jgi:hypothetical protein